MAKYSREIVTQVLTATDIVEIIGASLELKPSGTGRYVALCPFHQEKTPSFHVSRDKQRFYCFGCEKGGDVIGFISEFEGLSFVESLRKLAGRAGIQLPAMTERENEEDHIRSRLIEVGAFAARFYAERMRDPLKGGKARQYLKTRHLQDATVSRFGLGFAPDEWSALRDAAQAAGFKERELDASGLVKRGDRGSYYDTFRNRLMVPIRDVSGNVAAFGGRDLAGDSPAKYINSPETVLYKKSRVLYGLHEARDALRKEKRAILVEGYFDLMRCFDAGVCNVVATCGTALTSDQAGLIRRYVPEVVVVFDGDAAGVRAALRGVAILTAAGLTVRALVLPDGKDPDDFIYDAGAEAFHQLVDESLDFVTFYIRMNEERLGTIEGRTSVAKEVFTIIQSIDDVLRVDEYLKRAARELQLDEWSVRREFESQLRNRGGETPRVQERSPSASKINQDDGDFIAILLGSEPLRERAQKELKGISLKPGPLAKVLKAVLEGQVDRFDDEEAASLYAAAVNRHENWSEKAEALVTKRILSLKKEALLQEDQTVEEAIREAKRSHDTARETELSMRRIGIRKEIDGLGAA